MASLLKQMIAQDFGITGNGRWWRSKVHSSLVYDAEQDKFYWNSRGFGGGLREYLFFVRGIKQTSVDTLLSLPKSDFEKVVKTKQKVSEELSELFYQHMLRDVKTRAEYWLRRHISLETAERLKLGYYSGYNTVPVYYDGVFYNIQMRRDIFDDAGNKIGKKISWWYKDVDMRGVLFLADSIFSVKDVFIVEGLVDAIILNQEGITAVAPATGAGYFHVQWYKHFIGRNVIIIGDNDDAGRSFVAKAVRVIGANTKVFFFDKPKYDTIDFFMDGGRAEDLLDMIHKKAKYGFEVINENRIRS